MYIFVPPPFFTTRMQVFGFIRQEVGRAAAPAGGVSAEEGSGDDTAGVTDSAATAELSEKRKIVLAELPRLMELNKVLYMCCM